MPVLPRPANIALILTYLILSAVPFAPFLLGKSVEQAYLLLGVELIIWITIWALFKRPVWFHWLLIPAFLAIPTEIYLQTFYGQGISTHHLGIIAESSPREAIEFLGNKIWLMGLIMFGVIAWWLITFKIARRATGLDWSHRSRWVALATVAFIVGVWNYGEVFGIDKPPASNKIIASSSVASQSASKLASANVSSSSKGSVEDEEEEEEEASVNQLGFAGFTPGKLPYWAKIPIESAQLTKSWPFGISARGIDFYNERQYLTKLSVKSRDFKFGARQDQPTNQPEVLVMVLGESSRYDRWSLHGYKRPTNPLLSQVSNLVSLPDIITSVSATRLSVPIILSRKPAMQSLKDGFSEKSFLTAFKEAGFKTYWLSNQISVGHFDTPVSVFAKEADVLQFLNLGGFTNDSNYDQILLDPLKSALLDPNPKKLIVLHTLGNHWNYSHRHPKSFDKWQPSLFGVNKPSYTNIKIKPALNNSYDNSILYTDWFLSQVISTLKDSRQVSSMLYVSDHGQTLYDGSCNLAFHGHNTTYEFHIPALIWYSEEYETTYPEKTAQLKKHHKARFSTENIFHSILDMGNIRYPTERLEWSFFNAKFKQHKRYVDSYGWTNYDNAIIKGACNEVIDKGKPLKQER